MPNVKRRLIGLTFHNLNSKPVECKDSDDKKSIRKHYSFIAKKDENILTTQSHKHLMTIDGINFTDNNSVLKWLEDLRMSDETECLCILQAKSLSKLLELNNNSDSAREIDEKTKQVKFKKKSSLKNDDSSYPNIMDYYNQSVRIQDDIQSLRTSSHNINVEFMKLIRRIDVENWLHIPHTVRKLINTIRKIIVEFNETINYHATIIVTPSKLGKKKSSASKPSLQIMIDRHAIKDEENALLTDAAEILQFINGFGHVIGKEIDKASFISSLDKLSQTYERFYQMATVFYIHLQFQSVIQNLLPEQLHHTLKSVIDLCLQDDEIKKFIIQENGLLVLFKFLCDPYYGIIIDTILRTISTLCSCIDCVTAIEQVNGIGILTNLLCDKNADELIRTEAAACIAQITSPTLNLYHRLTGFIENIKDLILTLTVLCRDASNAEVFLISTAALAHMTFMDPIACEFLNQYGTAKIIIENCCKKNFNSIFIKDQVTTILANMALLDNCQCDIFENNGLGLLVNYLNERIRSTSDKVDNTNIEIERAAVERVQQKVSIAISRLAKDPKYADKFIQLGVIPRLVSLCQNGIERNESDAVLVACLAALRQISIHFPTHPNLNTKEVQQLIKPKLRDSFIMCSTVEETYV